MSVTGKETAVLDKLQGAFPFLREKARAPRARRLFVEVPLENFAEVFQYAVRDLGFTILCTITGLDLGERLGAIYHLANTDGIVLNLQTSVDKKVPVIQSVTPYFPVADSYERELVDLLGFDVRGLAPGSRYPLPDGWPEGQYPLRKDWNTSMLEEGKHA